MKSIVGYFNNYDEKTLKECEELYAKYEPILINKPAYTTEEANLWFKFMGDCFKNYLFPYYALQRVCETLINIYKEKSKSKRLGGTPDTCIILQPSTSDYDKKERYLAHAYAQHHNVMSWDLECMGIDTCGWHLLIRDSKTDRILRSGVVWSSANYLISLFAELRQIPTDQIETRPHSFSTNY